MLPLFRDPVASQPNILPGLLELMGGIYGNEVTPEDFVAHLDGIAAHPSFTERCNEELDTR